MLDIQHQCFTQTSSETYGSVFTQADLKEKKERLLYSPISCLVLKQESWKSWPNCPKCYTNDIKVNPTQKDTECL